MTIDIGQQMQQLYSQYGELPGISIELHKELLAIQVDNLAASATVFLQGAQLTHYQPKGQQPVIWCSPKCGYKKGSPLRGGIPVCWPWFGDLARNPEAVRQQLPPINAPAHGFARNLPWQLNDINIINDRHSRLSLTLDIAANTEPLWPYASQLQLIIDIGEQLTLSLTVSNLGQHSFNYSCALHSYFALDDINKVAVKGLEQCDYNDALDNWSLKKQQKTLLVDSEIDRIYHTHSCISLEDQNWQRNIVINSTGSNSTVLWNPWQNKSRQLSDFPDQSFNNMLCIETANANHDSILLASGDSHQLILNISHYPGQL